MSRDHCDVRNNAVSLPSGQDGPTWSAVATFISTARQFCLQDRSLTSCQMFLCDEHPKPSKICYLAWCSSDSNWQIPDHTMPWGRSYSHSFLCCNDLTSVSIAAGFAQLCLKQKTPTLQRLAIPAEHSELRWRGGCCPAWGLHSPLGRPTSTPTLWHLLSLHSIFIWEATQRPQQ